MSRFPGDPWGVLGLPPGSTREAIKARYRQLALELHPDTCKHPSHESSSHFTAVTEAAEKLLNQETHVGTSVYTYQRRHQYGSAHGASRPRQGNSSALLLAGLTFLAGVGVFVGSLWMHEVGVLGYQANTASEASERLHSPSERRQRLLGIMLQERQVLAAKRRAEEGLETG